MRSILNALVGLTVVPLTMSAPTVQKRAISQMDQDVLKLALYLEHLEYALYSGGYNTFSDAQFTAAGFPGGFRDNVGVIASHEQTHADAISAILQQNGVTPFGPCTYAFPYTDPASFVAVANMVTSGGIGAYLGGGANLVDNPDLLTTASTILTVEARHDTYLRTGLEASPFPTPYDTPLTALHIYSLVQQFIVSCPAASVLSITPLPPLMLVSPKPPLSQIPPPTIPAGSTLTFQWDPTKFFVAVDPNAQLYIAMINQNGPPIFVPLTKTGSGTGTVTVPQGAAGVAFAVLSTFSGGLTEMQLSQFGSLTGPAEVVLS